MISTYSSVYRIVTLLPNQLQGLNHKDIQVSLENLERLGLVELNFHSYIVDENEYSSFEELPLVIQMKSSFENDEKRDYKHDKMRISTTELGRRFNSVCFVPYK